MIRTIVDRQFDEDQHYIEATGLSTDTKPTGVITGSAFLEIDTGKIYFYNEAASAWIEFGASGS